MWGEGRYKPPLSPGQRHGGSPGGKDSGNTSNPAVHSTKKCPPPKKKHFLGTFLSVCCLQIERKKSFN